MTRTAVLSIAAAVVLGLAGCGSSSHTTSTAQASTSATTATAPSGTPTGPGSCSTKGITAISKIQGVCSPEAGVQFDFVNRGATLQLTQLDAKVDTVGVTSSLPAQKGRITAKGVYLVVTMTVTDRLSTPAAFDGKHSQVLLLTEKGAYPEDLAAERAPGSFASEANHPIPPGKALKAAIVWQLSSAEAKSAQASGLITVLQFSDAAGTTVQKPHAIVGALRLK